MQVIIRRYFVQRLLDALIIFVASMFIFIYSSWWFQPIWKNDHNFPKCQYKKAMKSLKPSTSNIQTLRRLIESKNLRRHLKIRMFPKIVGFPLNTPSILGFLPLFSENTYRWPSKPCSLPAVPPQGLDASGQSSQQSFSGSTLQLSVWSTKSCTFHRGVPPKGWVVTLGQTLEFLGKHVKRR